MNYFLLIAYGILNMLFVLLISPLFVSLIKIVKAHAQKRRGPPVLQTYRNLAKLLKKETIYSANSSWIMRVTPLVNVAALLVASLFVPILVIPQPTDIVGNIILFLYLLALAKFFMALSGLDAGSPFGGMGSSREMAISALIEPVVIVVFAALAFAFKTVNLPDMFRGALASNVLIDPVLILISISLFIVIIVESARVPVDNPETHLELTMIHEGMLLEYSGTSLALLTFSEQVKQLLLLCLLAQIIWPSGLISASVGFVGLLLALGFAFLKVAVLGFFFATVESLFVKRRLFLLPHYLATSAATAILALVAFWFIRGQI